MFLATLTYWHTCSARPHCAALRTQLVRTTRRYKEVYHTIRDSNNILPYRFTVEWPPSRIHSYEIIDLKDKDLSFSNVHILGDATVALTTIKTSPKQNWDAVLLFFQIKCQDNLDWNLFSLNLLTNSNAMQKFHSSIPSEYFIVIQNQFSVIEKLSKSEKIGKSSSNYNFTIFFAIRNP